MAPCVAGESSATVRNQRPPTRFRRSAPQCPPLPAPAAERAVVPLVLLIRHVCAGQGPNAPRCVAPGRPTPSRRVGHGAGARIQSTSQVSGPGLLHVCGELPGKVIASPAAQRLRAVLEHHLDGAGEHVGALDVAGQGVELLATVAARLDHRVDDLERGLRARRDQPLDRALAAEVDQPTLARARSRTSPAGRRARRPAARATSQTATSEATEGETSSRSSRLTKPLVRPADWRHLVQGQAAQLAGAAQLGADEHGGALLVRDGPGASAAAHGTSSIATARTGPPSAPVRRTGVQDDQEVAVGQLVEAEVLTDDPVRAGRSGGGTGSRRPGCSSSGVSSMLIASMQNVRTPRSSIRRHASAPRKGCSKYGRGAVVAAPAGAEQHDHTRAQPVGDRLHVLPGRSRHARTSPVAVDDHTGPDETVRRDLVDP